MEPSIKKNNNYKVLIVILIFILVAGLIGWLIGNSENKNPSDNNSSNADTIPDTASVSEAAKNNDVESIISYSLPDAWTEATCEAKTEVVYIIPNGTTLDCNANPSSPIKIYVDPQDTTDCQQLNNIQGVRKHVCISLYIDGHKSLKASTEYPQSSSYSANTTVSSYYIDTGKGVVRIDYTYTNSNDFQADFDQFATSIKVK